MAERDYNTTGRLVGLSERMVGKHGYYIPRPIETFFTTLCSHDPRKCATEGQCTRKSDAQRPGGRVYYKQIWLRHAYCQSCYAPQSSPISAYELHTAQSRAKEKLLIIPCQLCDKILVCYQPIMPFLGEFEADKKPGRRKGGRKKLPKS